MRFSPWLDKQKPESVLYLSFGSLAKITTPEFMEVVWGLEASEQPFLWVIRPGLVIGGQSWDQLLPESFQETPSFGDQFVNTKYITSVCKVGLELKDNKIRRGEIERRVRRLMAENEGDEMRQRAAILKEKTELCLKEEGSSLKQSKLGNSISLVREAITTSAAVILNTMEFLEHQALRVAEEALRVPILPIGPFHKITGKTSPNSLIKEDSSCISWLNEQQPRSVLYVSFGSIGAISEADIIEIAWGLEASKLPLLWVIRSGLIHGGRSWKDLLPTNMDMIVEDRACIVSWASQKHVLAHPAVGGFWSHCGWNSTLESVCEGVPMICTPFFGDQFADAKYVTSVWKVGLELKNDMFERSKIERCVRRLMAEKEGDEIRARAAVLKEKAESMLNGGASEKHLKRLENLIMSD
ncbi:UDP-glycosyltransferase 76E2-like protein [Drosera capensis]